MATQILAPAAARQYHLSAADRQTILSHAQNQGQKISRGAVLLIERQRSEFIQEFGNDGTENIV